MTDAELAAVPRFVIGRRGVGEIAFLYPVDLVGADLDAAVVLERGRAALYPAATGADARRRPAVGAGLNQPALVTFRSVRVRDPNDRRLVDAFKGRLLQAAARLGATHVHYDPDGGVWIIKLDRF
jgi:hypothetical protein